MLTLNHIYSQSENGGPVILVSGDLRAAFDTIDQRLLHSRLHESFVSLALRWTE
jgi:hypothetical protein